MKPENYAYVTYDKNGRQIKKKIPLSEDEYAVSNEHNCSSEMVVYKRKEDGSSLERKDGKKMNVIYAPGRILRDDDRDRMTVTVKPFHQQQSANFHPKQTYTPRYYLAHLSNPNRNKW